MKIEESSNAFEAKTDASLVGASRVGDRQAFGQIVTRYQRLLCSLAYSALGSLSESEDVAQEAFVEAWSKIEGLREPEKLKSWLCGILRFKISRHRRKEARQPLSRAETLEEAATLQSKDVATDEFAMKEEEKALLWQALETVPETYRETLILYYREHKSLEHVASELDLSEDAVKQRLSRGRKALQENMMQFIEGALSKSSPSHIFTASVMAAVNTIAPPVQAAGTGAAFAKVGSSFKWTTIAAFLASVSGFVSTFFALRANLDQSRTQRERRAIIETVSAFLGIALVWVGGLFGLRQLALASPENAGIIAIGAQVLLFGFVIGYVAITFNMLKQMRALRSAERSRRPDLFNGPEDQLDSKKREYRSSVQLLGVPLVHAKFAMAEENEKPAFGWIALGHKAYGLLFAWGGVATAPISVGIVSFGIVTAGAVGFGVLGIGTVGVGLLAIGAGAIGYKAYASLAATGWESAFSQGFSTAKEAAIGPIAHANEVNNELAVSIANLSAADQSQGLILAMITLMVIIPVVIYAQAIRKRYGKAGRKLKSETADD